MATPNLTAETVLIAARAALNDQGSQVATNAILLPYLNMALRELQEYYELNNIPVTDTVSAVMTVPAGIDHIAFEPETPDPDTPYLPNDLIEPKVLWERQHDVNPYIPMTRVDVLPRQWEGVEINQFVNFTWQSNQIRFLPANQDNDIKMDYIRNLFTQVEDVEDDLYVINAESFLSYRTAALYADLVEENSVRADKLNGFASLAMDRAIGIGTKGRQAINIRHRPFRASYKRRTYM